jgi:hypothetical protein
MPRTGSFQTLITVLLVIACTPLFAQGGLQVASSVSESQVFLGERITFSVVVSGSTFRNVGRPQIPDRIPGFRNLSLQPSTSTNYSIVNGVASRSYTYSYSLVAETPGRHTIPSVTLIVDDQTFTTEPINTTILDRGTAATQGSTQPEAYIKVEVSDNSPVVGQQVITELVLYFKSPLEIVSYQPSSNWVTDGFWKELLGDGSNPRAESVIIGGERYRRAVLLRHALFASRAGNLSIGEARVSITVRNTSRYSDPFSSFFGGFGTNQRNVDLTSDPINMNVRALPASNYSTINAVGNFNITRRISPAVATVGEAIEIITEIRGSGNLALISKPNYNFPEGFEVFQPQDQLNLNKETGEISGNRIFRDIIIVRRPGEFAIESVDLAYYDPSRRRYINANLPSLKLVVNRDMNAIATQLQQRSLAILPISGVVQWYPRSNSSALTSWWFWVGIILPVALVVVAYRKKQEDDKLRGDVNYARRVRSYERAQVSLATAKATTASSNPDVKHCLSILQNTIYNAVADRLGLQEASLDDEKVVSLLRKNSFPEESVKDIQRFLKKCSTIRFAPVIGRENLTHEIDRCHIMVKQICEVL